MAAVRCNFSSTYSLVKGKLVEKRLVTLTDKQVTRSYIRPSLFKLCIDLSDGHLGPAAGWLERGRRDVTPNNTVTSRRLISTHGLLGQGCTPVQSIMSVCQALTRCPFLLSFCTIERERSKEVFFHYEKLFSALLCD